MKLLDRALHLEQQIEVLDTLIKEKEQALKDARSLAADLIDEIDDLYNEKQMLHKRSLNITVVY